MKKDPKNQNSQNRLWTKIFYWHTVSTASFKDTTDSWWSTISLCLSSNVFDNVSWTIFPREITSFKAFSSHLQGQKQIESFLSYKRKAETKETKHTFNVYYCYWTIFEKFYLKVMICNVIDNPRWFKWLKLRFHQTAK